MLKQNDLLTMYRVQNSNTQINYFLPVKRVIVSKFGQLEFNPDQNRYIYFSRTYKHHAYYIFHKVFGIIKGELKKAKANPKLSNLNLPMQFQFFDSYQNVNIKVIKQVKDFFSNYLPPQAVELITFEYLNCFANAFEDCCINNKVKTEGKHVPEISDTRTFQGAYGINDAWLELLKSCIVKTKSCNLSIDKFFGFLLGDSYRAKVDRKSIKNVMRANPFYFEMLNEVTYKHLKNPDFYDKNNVNCVIKSIDKIEKRKLYNCQNRIVDESIFEALKREAKKEIELIRKNEMI